MLRPGKTIRIIKEKLYRRCASQHHVPAVCTVQACAIACALVISLSGCSFGDSSRNSQEAGESSVSKAQHRDDSSFASEPTDNLFASSEEKPEAVATPRHEELRARLSIVEDYREGFAHGDKGPEHQKYIVLHDTESEASASAIVDYWDQSGNAVAAHFIVNTDGSIVQCVSLDKIAHHAGFGDAGHNELFGVEDESRDDMVGTTPIGSAYPDYGMNSYSIGIEMVHVGGSGEYPEEQLQAVDDLIAYIDAYYGFESSIIDHKTWRTTNSDTSDEFAPYLANYQNHRTHN